jgi:hypothetical protein
VQNAVVHTVAHGVRYEDDIQGLRIWNSTFGRDVGRPFTPASSSSSVLEVRNVAVLGTALPAEASGGSNLAVPAAAFVNAGAHDYRLSAASAAADRGVAIAEVSADREGTARPQGAAYDIGAYERPARPAPPSNLRIIR